MGGLGAVRGAYGPERAPPFQGPVTCVLDRHVSVLMCPAPASDPHSTPRVKFWIIKNYMSPQHRQVIPELAAEYGFEYEFVTYKWPHWLHKQVRPYGRHAVQQTGPPVTCSAFLLWTPCCVRDLGPHWLHKQVRHARRTDTRAARCRTVRARPAAHSDACPVPSCALKGPGRQTANPRLLTCSHVLLPRRHPPALPAAPRPPDRQAAPDLGVQDPVPGRAVPAGRGQDHLRGLGPGVELAVHLHCPVCTFVARLPPDRTTLASSVINLVPELTGACTRHVAPTALRYHHVPQHLAPPALPLPSGRAKPACDPHQATYNALIPPGPCPQVVRGDLAELYHMDIKVGLVAVGGEVVGGDSVEEVCVCCATSRGRRERWSAAALQL